MTYDSWAGVRQMLGSPLEHRMEALHVLARVEQVLAAPATTDSLAPFLEDASATVRLYAAWKLRRADEPGVRLFSDAFRLREALPLVDQARRGSG